MRQLLLGCVLALLPLTVLAEPPVGEVPPTITLSGKEGGRVTGEPWSSDELRDKVHVLFYVDPDEKDVNSHVEAALKEEDFPRDKFASVAVINMAATWLPNRLIAKSLRDKQKEFPDTIYVRDTKSALVKEWEVADHNYDVLLFAPDGRLLFYRYGELSKADVAELIEKIKANLP